MKARNLPALIALVALASVAFVPAAFAAPVDWESVDVTVHDEGSSSVMLVTGTLPEGTKLPAEVEIAVPTGGKIQWTGEILGGDPAADPSVTPQVKTVGDHDIYTFMLTKSLIGQIEVVGPGFFRFDGTGSSGILAWTPLKDVGKLRLSVLVPTGGSVTSMTPGAQTLQGPQGATYVDKVFNDAKANEEVLLSLNYTAAPVSTSAPKSSGDTTLPLVIVLLVAAAGAVVLILAINRKMKNREPSEYEDDEEDSAFDDSDDERSASASRTNAEESVEDTAPTRSNAKKTDTDAAPKRSNAALIITATVITIAVAGGIMASQTSSSVTETPDGFVQEFAQGDPCNSITLALLSKPNKNDAQKLFDAVKTASPLRAVAYTAGTPRIEISFCDSTTSAEAVQSALAPTGLVGQQIQTPPAPTTP